MNLSAAYRASARLNRARAEQARGRKPALADILDALASSDENVAQMIDAYEGEISQLRAQLQRAHETRKESRDG